MSSATAPFGYPYPVSGDAVSDLATIVQSLAQAVDDQLGQIKCGTQASGVLVAGTVTTVAIVFATAFPVGTTPRITATLENVLGTSNYFVDVRSVSRTGFTLAFRRDAGTASMTAHWIAVAQ